MKIDMLKKALKYMDPTRQIWVIINERYGSSKTNPRDTHCLGPNKEVIVVVTREVHEESAPEF